MTATERERLAVVEEKQDRANADITEIKENQEKNLVILSEKIELLTKTINRTLSNHEKRISSAEETIEPFTKFRRNMWYMLVFSLLGVAFYVMVQTKKL